MRINPLDFYNDELDEELRQEERAQQRERRAEDAQEKREPEWKRVRREKQHVVEDDDGE